MYFAYFSVQKSNTSKPIIYYFCGFPQKFFLIAYNNISLGGAYMDKYEIFKKNINKLINIDLNYYKEKQMKRRIISLMNRNGFNDFDEYFSALKSNKDLLDQFINYLTINVSEFYRNPAQWHILEKEILPKLIEDTGKPLKVWSSACSTGEEPYSLVMLLSKFF